MMSNTVTISNKESWKDTDGNFIRAHGGGFLHREPYFYWFGENRIDGRKVSCYRSKDLSEWEFRNDVLTLDSKFKPIYYRTSHELDPQQTPDRGYGQGAVIERPKVLYNEMTGKFVMWMHWENGRDYKDARCAVATSDTVDGDYVYRGSFNPLGYMSRDCTLFQDDDGSAYFISAARDNADLLLYRLSDDYLSIDEHIKTLWPGQYREAPAVIKRGNTYFLVSSACTGWLPNQGTYAYAKSLTGLWSPLFNLGSVTTYDTQPTYIIPIRGTETTSYLYVGDRWDPSDYHNSSYVFLPLEFPDETAMEMKWADALTIDFTTGRVEIQTVDSGLWRLKSEGTGRYLVPADNSPIDNHVIIGEKLSYASESQKWFMKEAGEGFIHIKSSVNGKLLEPENGSSEEEARVVQIEYSGDPHQEWKLLDMGNGTCKILNRSNQKALTMRRAEGEVLCQTTLNPDYDLRWGRDPQTFLVTKVY